MTRAGLFALFAAAAAAGCGSKASSSRGCTDPSMIDDLEDGDRLICPSGGRDGTWFIVDDGTSTNLSPKGEFTTTAIPGGRGASHRAARMTGFRFTDTGVTMGVHLNGEASTAIPYDASAAQGVKFWVKSNVPITVNFTEPGTIVAGAGGTCTDGPAAKNCDNHFRFFVPQPQTDDWVEYTVPFSTLIQYPGLGLDAYQNPIGGTLAFNPSQLVGIEFAVAPNLTFDVWVDDVRFYSCATPDCIPTTCPDPSAPVACPPTQEFPSGCRAPGTDCAIDFPGRFFGVWGSGPADVWAVGYRQTAAGPLAGAIEHWDGAKWSSVPNAAAHRLEAVWGAGPNDVWAVGPYGTIEHWDGAKWSLIPSSTPHPLINVWGSGTSDVWAVGSTGTIVHWDGANWSLVPSGTTTRLWAVWGAGPSDVWAAGEFTIEHWDGSAWSIVPTGALGPFYGLWGSGPSDVWVVGSGIAHWNGTKWSNVPVKGLTAPDMQLLEAVRGTAPNDVWAVGSLGTSVHWDGAAWSVVPSNTRRVLYDVWLAGPADVWAVGFGFLGIIDHWDGAAWSLFPVGALP